ncbi:hypothetical protein GCM10011329_20010 [Stakelama pacifica]|nr:hypothetical protein GCM10011329_20010 [Stakelama pacifica]
MTLCPSGSIGPGAVSAKSPIGFHESGEHGCDQLFGRGRLAARLGGEGSRIGDKIAMDGSGQLRGQLDRTGLSP